MARNQPYNHRGYSSVLAGPTTVPIAYVNPGFGHELDARRAACFKTNKGQMSLLSMNTDTLSTKTLSHVPGREAWLAEIERQLTVSLLVTFKLVVLQILPVFIIHCSLVLLLDWIVWLFGYNSASFAYTLKSITQCGNFIILDC